MTKMKIVPKFLMKYFMSSIQYLIFNMTQKYKHFSSQPSN